MRTITINKGNWTGEETTVKIYKGGTFKLFGERFRMKERKGADGCRTFTVTVDGYNSVLARGYELKYDKLSHLDCFVFTDSVGDIERSDKDDPFVAAIQVLSMIF